MSASQPQIRIPPREVSRTYWEKRAREVAMRVAHRRGFSLEDITTDLRSHDVAHARDEAIAAVMEAFPNWTQSRVADVFGLSRPAICKSMKRYAERTAGGAAHG